MNFFVDLGRICAFECGLDGERKRKSNKMAAKNHKISARLGQIMGLIAQRGSITVIELARQLQVSEETVRRDARLLEERATF